MHRVNPQKTIQKYIEAALRQWTTCQEAESHLQNLPHYKRPLAYNKKNASCL